MMIFLVSSWSSSVVLGTVVVVSYTLWLFEGFKTMTGLSCYHSLVTLLALVDNFMINDKQLKGIKCLRGELKALKRSKLLKIFLYVCTTWPFTR